MQHQYFIIFASLMYMNKTSFNGYWDVTSQDVSESHMILQTKMWIHRWDWWVSGRQWMQWSMISVKIIWELTEALMLMWILHCRSNNIWREVMLLSSCFLRPLMEMNHCSSYQTPKRHNVTPVGHLLSSDIKFMSGSHVMSLMIISIKSIHGRDDDTEHFNLCS